MAMTLDGSLGVTFNDASLQGAAASPFGLKNRIINGDMRIDQRNAGASVTPTGDTYLLDRWCYFASQVSKFTWQQNRGSITPPSGFANYLGGVVATPVTIGSSDYFGLFQSIEGFNVADLDFGTANAKTFTLSFKIYSSLTGTFGGALRNGDGSRTYPFTYTISSANTWTNITLTIAGDTSGTWLKTNGTGLQIVFSLGIGSTLSGTAGSWSGSNFYSATGATSVVGTSGATFYITGVQLEIGSTATPFERRMYGNELHLCRRYYENTYSAGTKAGANVANDSQSKHTFAVVSNSKAWSVGITYTVRKRTTPAVTLYDRAGNSGQWYWGTYGVNEASSSTIIAANCEYELQAMYTSSYPAGTNGAYGHFSADAEL
jgi:hypothetical protein